MNAYLASPHILERLDSSVVVRRQVQLFAVHAAERDRGGQIVDVQLRRELRASTAARAVGQNDQVVHQSAHVASQTPAIEHAVESGFAVAVCMELLRQFDVLSTTTGCHRLKEVVDVAELENLARRVI